MTVTKIQGDSIILYFLESDGTYRTDKYITEEWIKAQNFMSAESVKEYVSQAIQETVADVIDQTLDSKLDSALDKKLSGISTEELTNIFRKLRRKLNMAKLQFATLSNLTEFLDFTTYRSMQRSLKLEKTLSKLYLSLLTDLHFISTQKLLL